MMSKLIKEITAFKQRATEHLQQKGKNAFMQIMQQNGIIFNIINNNI
ncbi:MAG: hypothetical protein LBJ63_06510 [Prevotellaceae bacterium]|jgi:hypothetical protein|nr:hypothetical protein [Prevotellaceae bacterium]